MVEHNPSTDHIAASALEPPPEASGLRQDFLFELFVGLKNARLLGHSHSAIVRSATKLLDIVRRVHETSDALALSLQDDALLFNEHRLRPERSRERCHEFVAAELAARDVRYLAFEPGITASELAAFLTVFATFKAPKEGVVEALETALARNGVTHVALDRDSDVREIAPHMLRAASAQAYLRSIQAVRKAMEGATSERVVSLQQAARCVQSLVAVGQKDEFFLLALGQIKNHDEYTYNHCVNVCTYALALGRRLQLNRRLMGRLGLAALFHDVGKTRIPQQILSKPGKLDDGEWAFIRRHPVAAVGCLSRCPGDAETLALCAQVALEHHRGIDGSGYGGMGGRMPHLFSRIVMIADIYDALTTPRVYRPQPWAPVTVFHKMARGELGAVDRRLLVLFIEQMGIFPAGSVVKLSDGAEAMVCRSARESGKLDQPIVKPLTPGRPPQVGVESIDLADASAAAGRCVTGVVSPQAYFETTQEYLQAIENL